MLFSRNLLVDYLRQQFRKDKYYIYRSDIFGYPLTPSHLGLSPDAGLVDETTTRIFIGTQYRYDITMLPSIVVKATSMAYRPISFNQNGVVHYAYQKIIDGYGNQSVIRVPEFEVFSGAMDIGLEVKITTKSLEDTVAIADIVWITLQHTARLDLQHNGLFIRKVSAGSETSENVNNNDPLFTVSISVEAYSEWSRSLPISNLVDRIRFCFDIDSVNTDIPATGLSIHDSLDF